MSVSMEEVQEDDDVVRDAPTVVHAEQAGEDTGGAPPSYEAVVSGVSGDTSVASVPASSVQTVFDPPPRPEPTVEEKIDRALNDVRVTGTDQQDVEEVMGNIISHLRAAVRSTGIDEVTGFQRDPVTDTFFWTSATYSRTDQDGPYNRQLSPNRWVTAFPDERQKIHLLQALSTSFQREFITQGTWYERFTSMVNLPPILHIHIQRSKGDGTKIRTPVAIPEVLHLDQFMDCEEGTELFARRRHAWNLQERIRSLKGLNGEPNDISFPPEAIGKATHYTNLVADEYLKRNVGTSGDSEIGKERQTTSNTSKDDQFNNDNHDSANDNDNDDNFSEVGVPSDDGDEDYVVIDNELREMMDAAGVPHVDVKSQIAAAEEEVDADVDKFCKSEANRPFFDEARNMSPEEVKQAWERQDLAEKSNQLMCTLRETEVAYEQELAGLFEDLKDPRNEYRLHAVVCHSGNTGTAGHYWVWVYDFERSIWRKYNDSVVEEEPDPTKVMDKLSNQGEPYYLAYVRASDVKDYVSVPLRKANAQQASEHFPSGIPPPPPRPHHGPVLKRISEEDSSDSSSPNPTLLTDDMSTTTISPVPSPPSHPMSHQPITAPVEADGPQASAVGGHSGQVDGSTLASRLPPPPLLPARPLAPEGDYQAQ